MLLAAAARGKAPSLTPQGPRAYPAPRMKPRHPVQPALSTFVALWLACGMGLAVAQDLPPQPAAATEPVSAGSDAVFELLQSKGLLRDAAASPFVQHMRDRASDMVMSAMHFLGVPYRRGGNTADEGFDCSGFTRHVFENSIGLVLPRRADEQARLGALAQVQREELKPGDLVFFNTMRRAFSHVGIYVGEGKFIHAPRTGGQVRIEDMRQAYWATRFNGARRAPPAPAAEEARPR